MPTLAIALGLVVAFLLFFGVFSLGYYLGQRVGHAEGQRVTVEAASVAYAEAHAAVRLKEHNEATERKE